MLAGTQIFCLPGLISSIATGGGVGGFSGTLSDFFAILSLLKIV